ncbi:MAG: Ig-like domain-containing protein [Bacteroidaceae bacterium]|nr:Ig-like domain-containing protein [Bacteroidaceae bacterium]
MKQKHFIAVLLLVIAGLHTAKAQYLMQVWKDGVSIPYVVNDVDSVRFVKAVTSIALSQESITIGRSETYQLAATLLPEDADVKDVVWESSDASIAAVDETGLVTAVALGSCTITASTTDGSNLSAQCQVKVGDESHGAVNGHEYVDLGLPSGTLWATCNVGAETPEDYGNYYAWGETVPKEEYTYNNYAHWSMSDDNRYLTISKYCLDEYFGKVDNLIELMPEDDAATADWGEGWQIPSSEQIGELMDPQLVTLTLYPRDDNDPEHPRGVLFTSKMNGNSIFLPAAGLYDGANKSYTGTRSFCWSRTLTNATNSANILGQGVTLSASVYNGWNRQCGLPVRPVCVQETPYIWPVTSLDMTSTELDLLVGEKQNLRVKNVVPSYINPMKLVYESSNESVAVYNKYTGYVTGVGLGTATITCRAENSSEVLGECQVTVTDGNSVTIDGHQYVDLGLPSGTLWATCNVGAETLGDYGEHFAWGETEPHDPYNSYTWLYYKYCLDQNNSLTKYCTVGDYGSGGFTDGLTELLPEDDAATANWGPACKTPNQTQCEELINRDYTLIQRVRINDVDGYKIISKVNGNAIFFPNDWEQSYGKYWTSTLNSTTPDQAYVMYFSSGSGYAGPSEDRCLDHFVRPVVVPERHEYVDLALPSGTLWATCNVGANSPEEYGDYFAWGETEPKKSNGTWGDYSWGTYAWMNPGQADWTQINKYTFADNQTEACWYDSNGTFIGDGDTELLPEDDAATANWGSEWQMPSLAHFEELIDSENTTSTWTTKNGVNGCLITSIRNNASIFLPAAGRLNGTESQWEGSYGFYWLNVTYRSWSDRAYMINFDASSASATGSFDRCAGESIRPVRVKTN